jgi:hypothetical protein
MTSEKLFSEVLGLGLDREVVASAFERESGVVRLRIEDTEPVWEAERIRLHKSILREQKA